MNNDDFPYVTNRIVQPSKKKKGELLSLKFFTAFNNLAVSFFLGGHLGDTTSLIASCAA
ncbi:hypothetical protein [Lederbergia citri]|uniref:Uncharacterized protein n=1 Tax=Lederbergia citri TaxID=2833580 RepID=A0A942TDF6_9BACI|nr:hypothetical protein [Lederbergia citri]MBS4195668.1 hypothetical protein [Lederbergia citri]